MHLACTAARNPNPISTRIFEKADKPFQNHAMPGRLCYLPGIAFFLSPFIKPLLYVEKLQIGTVLPVVSDLYREFAELSAHFDLRDDMGLRPLDLAGLSEVEGTPQRMNEAVWTIKNVSFAYKHEPETLHITETSFPSGSATAIIGHNGAGKSTFARCLCGLEKHFKGTVQDQSKNYSRKVTGD